MILVDSEIDLSTRNGKTTGFVNKTLSTVTRLIVGKLGQGMRCCKCNSTSNVFVCESQRKVYVWVRQ